jgi:bifunctional non-homologous end joining protein LigD
MARARRLRFIEPMKALPVSIAPADGPWLYEVKFDGFRVLAVKNGKTVELWSRNQKRLNGRFPDVAAAVAKLSIPSCILDGEVCALNPQGISSFQLLQNQAESDHPVVYYVFDLLAEKTRDFRELPLPERKKHMEVLLLKAKEPIRISRSFTGRSEKILEKMRLAGAEGAIAKRKDSLYEAGRRSGAWVKIKFHRAQEFVVVGYTLPRRARQYFGALLLGYYRGTRLVFAGHVGTGFSQKALGEIYRQLKRLECPEPAVEEVRQPSTRWRPRGWKISETRWVRPALIAQVQFTEWTSDGLLRHPSFQGLREDKSPADVVRE